MQITFLAFTSTRGGAAKAAVRVENLLQKLGCKSSFISIEDNENNQMK